MIYIQTSIIINLPLAPETLTGSKLSATTVSICWYWGERYIGGIYQGRGVRRKTKFNFRARIKRKRTLKQEVALFDAPLFENHG